MTRDQLTAPALAEQAAESLRTLCHRTIGDTLTTADTYAVLGELAAMAHRADQLAVQLGRGLRHRLDSPGYRLDHDGLARFDDPPAAIASAVDALARAALNAGQLGALLDTAHSRRPERRPVPRRPHPPDDRQLPPLQRRPTGGPR